MRKILITPQGFYFVKNKINNYLNNEDDYIFSKGIIQNKDKLIKSICDCEIAILGSEIIDKDVIDASRNLKLIIRFGTSTENIDKDYLSKKYKTTKHKIYPHSGRSWKTMFIILIVLYIQYS